MTVTVLPPIVPGKGVSYDRRPMDCVKGDVSKKGIRKAQALKANLAKRKQQQCARSITVTSMTPGQ